jgi:hypothetical protein
LGNNGAIILDGYIFSQAFRNININRYASHTDIVGGEKGLICFIEKPDSISNLPEHFIVVEDEGKAREVNLDWGDF